MTGFLFRIPRSAVRRITGAALLGLIVLFALAASGCGPEVPSIADRAATACDETGGVPRIAWTKGFPRYDGCDFPPSPCPCVERFRPGSWDCSGLPAEAPEVTP